MCVTVLNIYGLSVLLEQLYNDSQWISSGNMSSRYVQEEVFCVH